MNVFEVLFTAQGRIGRMAYLGYSLLNIAAMVALAIAAAGLWQGGAGPHAMLGVAIAAVAILGAMWSGICLTVKRLHDLGLTGMHVIWILALEFASKGMGPAMDSPVLAATLSVITAGIGVGLLICPGNVSENRYGPTV